MKRPELRKLLDELADLCHNIPFDQDARDKALSILSVPGVAAELRTLVWHANKNENT